MCVASLHAVAWGLSLSWCLKECGRDIQNRQVFKAATVLIFSFSVQNVRIYAKTEKKVRVFLCGL